MKFYGYTTDSLQTINRIEVEIGQKPGIVHAGDSLSLSVTFKNPYPYEIDFNHRKFPVSVCAAFLKDEEIGLFPVNI